MKKTYYFLAMLLTASFAQTACSDWDDHYEETSIGATKTVDAYDGDVVSYMRNTGDVKMMSEIFEAAGIYDSTFADREYTFIVCDDNTLQKGGTIADKKRFARYCVSDMKVSPAMLNDGYGIHTRTGKNIWVYGSGAEAKLDEFNITKTVKTDNGYIYYINGVLPIRQSVYEFLKSLDDANYSRFKKLVADNEETVFDKEHSAVIGVNNEGMTVYDSIKVVENELMDRYDENGIATWNMRDESYTTTMFIPTNQQIDNAVNNAIDSIRTWLNREPTAADTAKFEKWIVRACFNNRRMQEDEVSASAPDFSCVGDHQKIVDKQADVTRYSSIEAARWRPSVQTVDTSKKEVLSNGVAYYCTNLRIPNHVIIYRVKARFYELWAAMNEQQRTDYFTWNHWTEPLIINDAQGSFHLSDELPDMYYHVLTAIPDSTAMADSLECSVEYAGLVYDENTGGVMEANLPAGEYYLRMGFKHSLTYSLTIAFNDSVLVKDMVMYAQGSNFHFDRGAASEVPHYGEDGIAYPEGFDVDYWQGLDPKAIAYDTDGYTVGVVRLNKSGNFRIKVSSSDMWNLWDPTQVRNKNNVTQLMMYHWCLRPTLNNY